MLNKHIVLLKITYIIQEEQVSLAMESVIPTSLLRDVSKALINIVLDDVRTDKVPVEVAKKIIYLWRQDALATTEGVKILSTAAGLVNPEALSELATSYGLETLLVHA